MAAAAVIGAGIKMYGALKQGSDTASALEQQAQIQQNNASAAMFAARENAMKQTLIASKQIGGESAGYAAAGVASDSGSVLDVLSASAANSELDRQNILYGGQIRSINYENQASIDRFSGQSAKSASYFNAFGALTGGVTSASTASGGGGNNSGGGSSSQSGG